jgi:hypothetical protein
MGYLSSEIYNQKMEGSEIEGEPKDNSLRLARKYSNAGLDVRGFGQYGIGESTYDQGLLPQQVDEAIEESGLQGIEYLRSERQPLGHKIGLGLTRSTMSILTKAGEGLGFVGALPFAGIEAATGGTREEIVETLFDNFWVNSFANMEEDLKESMPIYKSKKYTEGTLGETIWTPGFWLDDFMDGAAFMASAMIPGMAAGKLGMIGKAGIGRQFATALSKTKLGKLGKGAGRLDKIANGIDMAGLTAYNTISEAGFEAKDTYDMLLNEGASKEDASDAAFRTFGLNALVLIGPNAIQQSLLFGRKGIVTPAARQAIKKSIKDGSFKAVEDLFPSLKSRIAKEVSKGIVMEGFVEEASQSAIQNYESKLNLTDEDWSASGLLTQYIDGIANDKDTQKALIIGSILGAGGGAVGAMRSRKDDLNNVEKIKKLSTLSNDLFNKNLKTIYKTESIPVEKTVKNSDGKETTIIENEDRFILDENGKPIIDTDKVAQLAKQLVYDKKLIDETAVATILGNEEGAEMLTDLILARSVFNYASEDESGLSLEYFKTKLEVEAENQKNLKPEDRNGISELLAEKLERIDEFADIFKNTYESEENSMIGKIKFFEKIKQSSFKRSKADTSSLIEDSENFINSLTEDFIKSQQEATDELKNINKELTELVSTEEKSEEKTKKLTELFSEFAYLKEEYEEAFGNVPLDIITQDEFERDAAKYKPGIKSNYLTRFGDRYLSDTKVKAKLSEVKSGEISPLDFFNSSTEQKEKGGITEQTQKEINEWFESRNINKEKENIEKEIQEAQDVIDEAYNNLEPISKEQQATLDNAKKKLKDFESTEKQITDARNRFNSVDGFLDKESKSYKDDMAFLLEAASNILDNTVLPIISNYNLDKESYTQIGLVNKAIEKIKTQIKVLERRGVDVSLQRNYIKVLEGIKTKVEENLRNRKVKQKKFEQNQSRNFYRGMGIEIDESGYKIVDKALFDIITEVVGEDKLKEILVDAVLFEDASRVLHAKVILDLFKEKSTVEQKAKLLNYLKSKKKKTNLSHTNTKEFIKSPYKNSQLVLTEMIKVTADSKNNPYVKFQNSNDPFEYLESLKSYTGNEFDRSVDDVIKDVEEVIKVLGYQDILEYLQSPTKVEEVIEKEKEITGDEYKFAPTNQQLFAIRQFYQYLKNPTKNKFVSYLKGIAGSGKTSVVGNFLSQTLGLQESEILTAAHTNWSSNNIKNSITPEGKSRTIKQLIEEIDGLAEDGTIKMVILDEVGGMLGSDIIEITNKIKSINEQRNTDNKPLISLLLMGDPTQLTESSYGTDPTSFLGDDINVFQAPTLNLVYRSDVSSIAEVSSAFQSNPFSVEGIYTQTNSETDDRTPLGVNKLSSFQDIINNVTKRLGNGRKKLIIVRSEEDKQKYDSLLDANRKVEYEGVQQEEVEVVTVLEAQGRTIPEVYVDVNTEISDDYNNNIMENKLLYTAISRASQYVGIVDYGNWLKEVQDVNIVNDIARNKEEIKDLKEEYENRIIDELTKIYKLKEINKTVTPTPTTPTTTVTPVTPTTESKPKTETEEEVEEEESEQEDIDIQKDDDVEVPEEPIEEQPDEIGDTPEGSVSNNSNSHWIKFPTFPSLKTPKTKEQGITAPERVQAGAKVIYVGVSKNRKKFVAILAENPNGDFVEIGVMSQEEMNTPLGRELQNRFDALGKSVTYRKDSKTGIVTLDKNYNVLKQGKLSFKQGLTYVYSKEPKDSFNILDAAIKFIDGFFKKAGLIASAGIESKMYIRIFSHKDLQGTTKLDVISKSRNMEVQAGIPYLVIENPSSKNSKENTETATQFIRLMPKKLNINNKLLKPIMKYKSLIDSLEGILSFKLGDDKFSIYIDAFKDNYEVDESGKFPVLKLKEESKRITHKDVESLVSKEEFDKTKQYATEIIPLLYSPKRVTVQVTDEEFEEFIKTTSIDKNLIEKKPIKGTNKSRILIINEKNTDKAFYREYKPSRGSGEAQHSFNALARANSSIRVNKNIPGSSVRVRTFGKSLIEGRAGLGAYKAFLNHKVNEGLKDSNDKAIFVKDSNIKDFEEYLIIKNIITPQELEDVKKELTKEPVTSSMLEELFGESAFDDQGNHSFRTPLNMKEFNSIAGKAGDMTTAKQQKEVSKKMSEFINSNLMEVKPTRAQVVFNDTVMAQDNTSEPEQVDDGMPNINDINNNFNFSIRATSEKNSTFAKDIEESKKAEEIKKKCK